MKNLYNIRKSLWILFCCMSLRAANGIPATLHAQERKRLTVEMTDAPILDVLEREPDVAVVSPKLISWTDRTKFEYAGASVGFIDFLGYPFCRGRIPRQVESDQGQ